MKNFPALWSSTVKIKLQPRLESYAMHHSLAVARNTLYATQVSREMTQWSMLVMIPVKEVVVEAKRGRDKSEASAMALAITDCPKNGPWMPSISIGTSGSLPFGTQTLMLMACVLMAFAGSICKIDTIAIHGMTWRPAKARNSHLVDQNCTLGTSDWLRKAGRDKSEASAMALPLQIALKTGPECHQSALAQVAACLLELRHSCWWHVYWWNKANLLRISELFWFSSFFFIYYTFIQPCSDVSPLPTTNTQWGYCHATCCNFQYIKKTTWKYSAMTHFFLQHYFMRLSPHTTSFFMCKAIATEMFFAG